MKGGEKMGAFGFGYNIGKKIVGKLKEEQELKERQRRMGALALKEDYYARIAAQRFRSEKWKEAREWNDNEVTYKAIQGWSHDLEKATTNIIIYIKGQSGHYHFVATEDGEILISEWRDK